MGSTVLLSFRRKSYSGFLRSEKKIHQPPPGDSFLVYNYIYIYIYIYYIHIFLAVYIVYTLYIYSILCIPGLALADSPVIYVNYGDPESSISLMFRSRPGSMDFSERKNPEYDFLRKGSKTVRPVPQIYFT